MPSPIENNLLLYYLSGIGSEIGGEGSVAASIGGMTQQHIQSRNFMKMLQSMLGQGGSVKANKDKFTFDLPSNTIFSNEELSGMLSGTGTANVTVPAATPTAPAATTDTLSPEKRSMLMSGGGMGLLNPSPSLPDISGAGLAGLTPKDISQALQFKMGYEELGQKRMTDLVDMIYKGAQISKLEAEESVIGEKLKPADVRSYEYATGQGFEGTLEDWKNIAESTHEKDYERAVSEGYEGDFYSWLMEFQKAGATRISLGELGKRKEQEWDIKSRKYFTSKDFSKDIDTYINETVRRAEWMSSETPDRAKAGMIYDQIEKKITSQGGKIKGEPKVRGRTVVWTVKWPDGETSEVSYAF